MRYTNLLLDEELTKEKIGDIVTLKEKYKDISKAIDYFLRRMETSPLDVSFDVGAGEPPYFRTINYTSYINGFMLKPLAPDWARLSVVEALSDNVDDGIDYNGIIANMVLSDDASKYRDHPSNVHTDYACEAVVVMPGHNKLNRTCLNKLRWISAEHGKLAVFKPHPLTDDKFVQELRDNLYNHSTVLEPTDNLYHYLKKAKIVYTSYMSESAVYATALGKKISPIDAFQERMNETYSHINEILFMLDIANPINRIFSSYKSGVIMPAIQPDWQYRIDKYVDYMEQNRARGKDQFVQPYTKPLPKKPVEEQEPDVQHDK